MKKRLFFQLPILPVLFFLGLFAFSSNNLLAQSLQPVIVTVSIKETGYHKIDDKGKNRLVWKFYKGAGVNQDSVLKNAKAEFCFTVRSKKNNKIKEINDEKDDLNPFLADISGFKITMEAFLNKKGGDKCDADKKDPFYRIGTRHIKLDKLSPGEWSEEIKIEEAFGNFDAVIVYKYDLANGRLGNIESSGNSIKEASNNIVLNLPMPLPKKEVLPFTWSYSMGDEENWAVIPNSREDKSKIEFYPLKAIFQNKNLLKPTEVKFKAEVEMSGKPFQSDPFSLTFVPSPPAFYKEDILLIPVCNGLANGGIVIKNIKANASEVKYVLRNKAENMERCNLKDPKEAECPGFVRAGTIAANSTLKIRNLAAGDYVIYIFNGDLESGEVNTTADFRINPLPPLKSIDRPVSYKDPTCDNEKSGEIYMDIEGGKDLWQIVIMPNKGKMSREGNTISFKGLEAGNYTVYLHDQCGGELSKNFNLKKPKQLTIDNKETIQTRQDKTDFYVLLNIKNGSNDYKVILTDPQNNVTEKDYLLEVAVPISMTGNYKIEIKDKNKPACLQTSIKIKVEKSSNPKVKKFKVTPIAE
ncbi:MAG: hypothetical protein ABIO79_05220 [Ferruginibacter sp.]